MRPDGLLYDCGVELSPEGQFGRQDYKKHACRGTYTLHSLYLLLWANFGCFCVTLLTQPDSDQRIHGKIISEWLSLRHYCVSQLKTLWLHLRNNLGLTDEQRAFFVMRAMDRLWQVGSAYICIRVSRGISVEALVLFQAFLSPIFYSPALIWEAGKKEAMQEGEDAYDQG